MAKFYVVWHGRETGIFTDWETCKRQIHEFPRPRYKSFDTRQQAEIALKAGADQWKQALPMLAGRPAKSEKSQAPTLFSSPGAEMPCLVVDASFMGNTGLMEYQCIALPERKTIFASQPVAGATGNIGEFLALVSAARYVLKHRLNCPIYTDSKTALAWYRDKYCRTNIREGSLFGMPEEQKQILTRIVAAEQWLRETALTGVRVLKWETTEWGENPADYGRK